MPKSGIKIISETIGFGRELKKGDHIRLVYDIQLNKGEFVVKDQENKFIFGNRESAVAGFRYGLEGMRDGGTRDFKASPHLCYRDLEVGNVPKNAVLIFKVKQFEILSA